jgi:ATP phosphoribosyltransferase
VLSLVLPKGSLEKATLDLFDSADLAVRRGSDRDYHASVDHPGIERVRFLRPQEIPQYVEQGLFDLGITGRDWITETDADVVSLGRAAVLEGHVRPGPRRPRGARDAPWRTAADLPEGIRISTEFPMLTRRYLEAHGVKASSSRRTGRPRRRCPTSSTPSST